jgi:hypothetical protein
MLHRTRHGSCLDGEQYPRLSPGRAWWRTRPATRRVTGMLPLNMTVVAWTITIRDVRAHLDSVEAPSHEVQRLVHVAEAALGLLHHCACVQTTWRRENEMG